MAEQQSFAPPTPKEGEVTPPAPTIGFKIGDREYDQDAVITKITHADALIEEQKRKLAEMDAEVAALREEAARAKKLEDIYEHIKKQPLNKEGDTNPASKDELLREIEERLQAKAIAEADATRVAERERIRKETFAETQTKLIAKFGAEGVDAAIKAVMPLETAIRMASDPELSGLLLDKLQVAKGVPTPAPDNHAVRNESSPHIDELPKDFHRLSGRKRTEAFREQVEKLSTPEALAALRNKFDNR